MEVPVPVPPMNVAGHLVIAVVLFGSAIALILDLYYGRMTDE